MTMRMFFKALPQTLRTAPDDSVVNTGTYYPRAADTRVIKRRDAARELSVHNGIVELAILIGRVFLSSSRLGERDRNCGLIGTRDTLFSEPAARAGAIDSYI